MKLRRKTFTQRIRLGKTRLTAEIDPEAALCSMKAAAERAGQLEDPAALCGEAAQLFTDIFGEENARALLSFYGGRAGETALRLMPLLLGKVLRKAARREKREQKRTARVIVKS